MLLGFSIFLIFCHFKLFHCHWLMMLLLAAWWWWLFRLFVQVWGLLLLLLGLPLLLNSNLILAPNYRIVRFKQKYLLFNYLTGWILAHLETMNEPRIQERVDGKWKRQHSDDGKKQRIRDICRRRRRERERECERDRQWVVLLHAINLAGFYRYLTIICFSFCSQLLDSSRCR